MLLLVLITMLSCQLLSFRSLSYMFYQPPYAKSLVFPPSLLLLCQFIEDFDVILWRSFY